MNLARALKYAAVQARLRARIGKLPDRSSWNALASAPGRELLEGLDGIGVDFWTEGLSASVSGDALERHFNGRIRHLARVVADWLPTEWHAFSTHLVAGPDVFWLAPVLDGEDPGSRLDRDSMLHPVLRAAQAQRRAVAARTPLCEYLDENVSPPDRWRSLLAASIPEVGDDERRPVARLVRVLDEYLEAKSRAYRMLIDPSGGESEPTAPGTWSGNAHLEDRLYLLLAGDPFHPGLILVYGLLELLTMERLRALLLCRLYGWPAPPALTVDASC